MSLVLVSYVDQHFSWPYVPLWGADYWFKLISIETYAPQFIGHNKIFLGSVVSLFQVFVTKAFCDNVRPFTCAQSVLKDRLCIQYSPVIVVLLRYCLYLLLLSCFFCLFVTNVFKDWFIKNRTKPSSNKLLSSSNTLLSLVRFFMNRSLETMYGHGSYINEWLCLKN